MVCLILRTPASRRLRMRTEGFADCGRRTKSPASRTVRFQRGRREDRLDQQRSLTRYAWVSIAAAVVTIALKFTAYLVTDSVGLLSDALESLVNLAAALMALAMLTLAARPPDDDHAYGHGKAEYFASSFEG